VVVDANATLQQARDACALHSGDVVAYLDADKQLMVEVRGGRAGLPASQQK
jgi:hypothetical protein